MTTDIIGESERYVPTFDLDTVPEEDRERVAALIPDPAIAEGYVHRTVHGWYDFALFDYAIQERENLILFGPTGSSKTTALRAYAAARGLPFVAVDSEASMDIASVLGGNTGVDPETGQATWQDGEMLLVVRYGGVLLIDEINLVHQRITAGFHQLLSVNRRISVTEHRETVRGGRGGLGTPQPLLLAAAFNDGRYEGTVRLNQALRNRYAMPIRWRYDRNVEEQLIPSERLLDMADNMRNMESVRTPVSTNALQEFVRHARGLDMRAAVGFFLDRFDDDERNSVSLALEAESAAIASELGVENIVFVHESVGDDDDE